MLIPFLITQEVFHSNKKIKIPKNIKILWYACSFISLEKQNVWK